MLVSLSAPEYAAACSLGRKREALRVERQGQRPVIDGTTDWVSRNEIGCVAEYALARYYGKTVLQDWVETKSFILGDPRTIPCDVGRDLHVRATDNPAARFLVIHEAPGDVQFPTERRHRRRTDPHDGVFILAFVDGPSVLFRGWQHASWVRDNCEWNMHTRGFSNQDRHAYTCPADQLLPMNTIPEEAIW